MCSAGGADTLRLFYTKRLDIRHVLQQHASLNRTQSMSGMASSNSMIRQPRLGLAGLDALQHPDTVHEEVRMRMTATALQLALLATRQVRMQSKSNRSCLVSSALLCLCCRQLWHVYGFSAASRS
jgi:hypothetical protein